MDTPYFGTGYYKSSDEGGSIVIGQTGTLQYIESIRDIGDGLIEWRTSTVQFEKGLMVTAI